MVEAEHGRHSVHSPPPQCSRCAGMMTASAKRAAAGAEKGRNGRSCGDGQWEQRKLRVGGSHPVEASGDGGRLGVVIPANFPERRKEILRRKSCCRQRLLGVTLTGVLLGITDKAGGRFRLSWGGCYVPASLCGRDVIPRGIGPQSGRRPSTVHLHG